MFFYIEKLKIDQAKIAYKQNNEWEREKIERLKMERETLHFTTGYHCTSKLPHITYYDNDGQMTEWEKRVPLLVKIE